MSILLPRAPLLRQPLQRAGINRRHPLARNLHWALGAYSGERALWDSVSRTRVPFYSASGAYAQTWQAKSSLGPGMGVVVSNSGVGATAMAFGDSAGSASPTNGSGASGHAFTLLFGLNLAATPAANSTLFDGGGAYCALLRLNTSAQVELIWPGVTPVLNAGTALTVGADSVVVVTYTDQRVAIYYAGVEVAAVAAGAINWYKGQAYLWDWWANGTIMWGATAWKNRALSAVEARDVSHNPWAIYAPPERKVWAGFSAGSTVTATASLSAVIQLAQQATTSLSAAVQRGASASSSADSAIQAARSAQAGLEAAVQAAGAATSGLQVAVQATPAQTASLDAAVQLARSATAALELAVQAQGSTTASLSAQVQAPSSVTSVLDAYVQAGSSASVSLGAAVLAQAAAAAGVDAAVQAGRSATVGASAALQLASSATAAIGLAVQLLRTAGANLDLQVQSGTSAAVSIDVAVRAVASAATGVQIAIAAAVSTSLSLGAAVMLRRSLAAAMDSAARAQAVVSAGLSAYVQAGPEPWQASAPPVGRRAAGQPRPAQFSTGRRTPPPTRYRQ